MPVLSIVVCATGATSLGDTMRSLTAQTRGTDLERVLVARLDNRGVDAVHVDGWRVVRVDSALTLGQLFIRGLRATTAPVVAITPDRFIPETDWVGRVQRAHAAAGGPTVVAGAIDVASDAPLVTRAVFGCEYAGLGVRGGATAAVAANLSMSRESVDALVARAGVESWDADWGRLFAASGIAVAADPQRRVRLAHRFTVTSVMRERYHFSRTLSGLRDGTLGPVARVGRAWAMPLLPLVLAARFVVTLRRLPRSSHVSRTLPLMLCFTLPWALGDFVGIMRGPGASARKVG